MKHAEQHTYMHATKSGFVHSRIEEDIRKRASFILGKIGLNVSDAIRLFLNQVVMRKGMPFPVCIPNAETIAAMEAVERGEDVEVVTVEQLGMQFSNERKKTQGMRKKLKKRKL